MQHTHPKLTAATIDQFIIRYKKSGGAARLWLGKTLGVGKTQRNQWAQRILADQVHEKVARDGYVVPVCDAGGVKRLYWDMEVSPNIGFFWKAGYKLNVPAEAIIHERKIICIGYKWEGDDKVTVLRWDSKQDDKAMLIEFLKALDQADESVYQNGDSFDLPWLRTRCLYHGLQVPPDQKTADTLQWMRRKFYFNSNRLDYVAKYLKIGGKIHTGFELWRDIVLHNSEEALDKMMEYCAQDVRLLEKLWHRLRLFVKPKVHAGVAQGRTSYTCSHCGSDHVTKSKTKITAAGTVTHQMRCNSCGGYTTVSQSVYASYLADKKENGE